LQKKICFPVKNGINSCFLVGNLARFSYLRAVKNMQEIEFRLQALLLRNRELEAENTHLHQTKSLLESQAGRLSKSRAHLSLEHERLQSDTYRLQEYAVRLEEDAMRLRTAVEVLESDKADLESTVLRMKDELVLLRRAMFGRSSERYIKVDPDQLLLDFGGETQIPEEEEYLKQKSLSKVFTAPPTETKKRHPVRKALPEHLERVDDIIEPKSIPEGSVHIGDEVTEVLEYRPGELYVRRIVRRKYALKGGEGVIIGELPSLPLPKSSADASLLAHLLVSKFQDHLPLYRQIEILRREGVHLSASTVNDWVTGTIELIRPLYDKLRQKVLESDYIQVDESTIPVMDKDKPGATRKGYHWVVRSPEERCLFFHYDRGSRGHHVIVELLKDYRGAVQSDGYGAYEIYEKKEGVLLLGCWAHVRRKFEQALGNDPPRAEYAIEQIQKLYAIERRITDEGLTKEQAERLRKDEAYPVVRAFEVWLEDNRSAVLPKSRIGIAIEYAIRIYPRLGRYVVDGRYRMDNNLAENAVRPLALGRKNYMFCGNHEAAERTAMIYSLLGTCKVCGVNPTTWLTHVLSHIDQTKRNVRELLPDRWAEARVAAADL
jgi:transposase